MSIELLRHIKQVDIRAELFRRRHFDFVTKSEVGYHEKQELALTYLTNKETKIIVYGGAAGGSKVVPDNGVVLTPFGFKKGRDLQKGDAINNPDGSVSKIIKVHPRYTHKVWTVRFHDGTETIVTGGHLWLAWRSGMRKKIKGNIVFGEAAAEVVETETLLEWLNIARDQVRKGSRPNWPEIPVAHEQPFNVTYKKRSWLDPYILGHLLGDGCFTGKQIAFTTSDQDHFKPIYESNGFDVKQDNAYTFRLRGHSQSELKSELQKLGLLGLKSETKFIPKEFQYSPIDTRYAIVQGLMDADGTVDNRGHISFTTVSKQLADDMAFVLRSLGAVVTITQNESSYKDANGEKVKCLDNYNLYIKHRKPTELFRLNRHKARAAAGVPDLMYKRVVDIQVSEDTFEGRCITVSHPNGLYLTNDFIVTHNSWTGGSWLMFMSYLYPGSRWFVGRNELKRLRQSTLPTIYKLSHRYGLRKEIDFRFHGQDNYINFKNGSRIDLLDLRYLPGDPLYERFGSIEYTGGWIEEAGEVDFNAFDVLKSRIGRHLNDEYDIKSKLFITLNPKKNWCYTRFYLPHSKAILPKNEVFIKCLVDENPFIESGYIEGLDEIEDKQLRERLRHGNWEYDDDSDALVSYDALCDLFTNNHIRPNTEERYITADIALEGSDYLEIGVWFGDVLVDHIRVPKSDGKKVYLLIDQIKVKYRVPNSQIIYDADGIGGFIAGFVKGAVAFHNGSAPLNGEKYDNIKSQLYYYLAKQIEDRKIWYAVKTEHDEEERIKTQLSAQLRRATADDDNKLRIKKKSEVKKDLGVSPDTADMFMMRMYFKINKKPKKAPRTVRVLS